MKKFFSAILLSFLVALESYADFPKSPLAARSWQCQAFNLETFCGYVFGSDLPETATTNSIRKKLDKPFRACTHVRLGYTTHTRKLFRVDFEGDLDGWSFAAITNEAENVKGILEDKLGVPLRRDSFGRFTFSNNHISVSILSLFKTPIVNATLQKRQSNYFCVRVESKDVFEESERLQKERHEKSIRKINHAIPPGTRSRVYNVYKKVDFPAVGAAGV